VKHFKRITISNSLDPRFYVKGLEPPIDTSNGGNDQKEQKLLRDPFE